MLPQSVTFDWNYATALVDAAIDTNHVLVPERLHEPLESGSDPLAVLFNRRATRRLRRAALEMAVLHDQVHLVGAPAGFDLARIRSVIPGLDVTRRGNVQEISTVPSELAAAYKPLVIKRIERDTNQLLAGLGLSAITHREIGAVYHWLVQVLEHVNLAEFIDRGNEVGRVPYDAEDAVQKLFLESLRRVPGTTPDVDSVARARAVVLGVASDLMGFHTLLVLSRVIGSPLLTDRIRAFSVTPLVPAKDLRETFSVCQVVLTGTIGYAPAVQTFEDVLRYRERKEIHRFREVLAEWVQVATQGKEQLFRRATRDVERANRELRRLGTWRSVDRWLYWLAIPTSLLPVISSVVTVAGVATRWRIERSEAKHGWVAIGR